MAGGPCGQRWPFVTSQLQRQASIMRASWLAVLLLPVLTPAAPAAEAGDNPPVVTVKNGRLRGEYVTVKGTQTRAKRFLGIPFARAPLGRLRLAAPQEPENWEGERDGTRQPPMCIQDPAMLGNISQVMAVQFRPPEASEDCLYLSVYARADAASGARLPVLVWIHGGGLVIGAGSQYDGAPLAAYENLLVVVIQYRLGILGFLSTGDQHARGNYGFLDQLAALRWVQENIQAFGGDPEKVTVSGESAGGISASMLTLSPLASGLFHRAIFQSGVAMLGAYATAQPLAHAKVVANLTGCDSSSTQELVSCVRGRSQAELIDATKRMKIYLGAAVDGEFLTDTPEELLKKKEVLKVPVMMGITNHEFGWILPQSFAPPGWVEGMTRESVLAVMDLFNPAGASAANQLIADHYLKEAKTPEQIRDSFTEVMGDLLMTFPVVKVAGYHSDASVDVFLYEFVHRAELHKGVRPDFVRADHADEVGFMFGGCFWNGHVQLIGNITAEDQKLCRAMMKYWANFARTGSPNGPDLVTWPRFQREEQAYLELGATQAARHHLRRERVHFVTVTLPQKLAAARSWD